MQRIRHVVLLFAVVLVGGGATAGSASARGNILPDTSYAIIVQANAELADLDSLAADEITDKQRHAERRKICRNYPTSDPLLKTRRDWCLEVATAEQLEGQLSGSQPPCRTVRACRRVVQRLEVSHGRWYRIATNANRIATEVIPASPCRDALVLTSTEMRYYRQFDRLKIAYLRAWLSDNERSAKAILRRAKKLEKMKVRPAKERNALIATHC